MLRFKVFFLLIILSLCTLPAQAVPSSSATAKSKRTPLSIPCPIVIADQRDGTFYSKLNKESYPFLCFPSVSKAVKKGFRNLNTANSYNYTGWYRLSLKLEKDACDPLAVIGSGPVLFLQIKENDSGVFGEFCPSIGNYGGTRTGAGFVISGIDQFSELPEKSMCADGKIKKQQVVEMTKIAAGNKSFVVSYKEIRSCSSSASGANTCSREFGGHAEYETHPIWPKVSDNLSEIPAGCGQALKTCGDCHAELRK